MTTKFEIHDLCRYFHNVRKDDGGLNPILGEDRLALTMCVSYLLENTNCLINAYSGTGKTVVMDAVLGLLPDQDLVVTIEQLSDTAIWYMAEEINDAVFVAIPEAQKAPENVIEILKTWADGRNAERRKTDITNRDQITDQILRPKFVFMSKAVENQKGAQYLDAELERRYLIGHTNPTTEQTEDVLRYKLMCAAVAENDIADMTVDEITTLKQHILECIMDKEDDIDEGITIKNPCAPFLFDLIPSIFPISRSKVHYLLKVINGVARFYPDEMMTVVRGNRTYKLVTPKHNWLGVRIYLTDFINECLQLPAHGIDILQLFQVAEIDPLTGLSSDATTRLTVEDVQKDCSALGFPFSKKAVKPLLMSMVMTGFLEYEKDQNGKEQFFRSPLIADPEAKVSWSDIVDKTIDFMHNGMSFKGQRALPGWPEIADEFITRHCTDLKIQDPITGNIVDILKPNGGETEFTMKQPEQTIEMDNPIEWLSDEDWQTCLQFQGLDLKTFMRSLVLAGIENYENYQLQEIWETLQ